VRVIGVVQCKNEWGLIAMSVSHALLNHVDAVWVLDDGSSDQSAAGYELLSKKWGNRLTVIHLDSIGFEQEAITNTLVQLAVLREQPDWVYPFDADEFLILDDGASLRELLLDQPDNVDEVRYTVKNFVSPTDFDENRISDYRRQRFQSKALRVASIQTKEHEIRDGTATFFDFGFMSKVIFRAQSNVRLDRGSHSTKIFGRAKVSVSATTVRAVHLPMLSRARVERKAQQGKAHLDVGAPGGRGWQNQFIYKQQQTGKLDEFWIQHSINPADVPNSVVETSVFSDAIEATIGVVTSLVGSDDLLAPAGGKLPSRRAVQTEVGLADVVRVGLAFQAHTSSLLHKANRERRATMVYKVQRAVKRARKNVRKFLQSLRGRDSV
jgi:hypothetical protein